MTSSSILILRTPHFATNPSSGIGSSSSSSSSSYRVGRWDYLSLELQSVIHQFLNTKEQTLVQVSRTWRNGTLHTWEILTRNQYRFNWRETNFHPRLNHLLTKALMDIVFEMREERGINYEPIALGLKEKYKYLMAAFPSFRCYAMMRLNPHLGSKIIRSFQEFNETEAAEKTIYANAQNLSATSDTLLYVLIEIEKISSSNPEKLTNLLDLVIRAIGNGVTCASLLMIQKPHVWPLRMLEQMAIASLKKEDYRALETLTQTYSVDDLQSLQEENSDLVLPPVLYHLALQEKDLYKQDVALEAAIKAYGKRVSPQILCDAASIKFNLGCHTEAIDLVNQAMRLSEPEVPDFVLIKKASFMFKLKQYEEADRLFMQIISRDVGNTPALIWYHSAYTKRQLKQYEEAYEHYMCAIKEYEGKHRNGAPPYVLVDGAYAILDLIEFANWNGEEWDPQIYYEKADEFYTEAIKRYGDKVPAHVLTNAADLKLQLKRYEEADLLYSELIEKFGDEIKIEDLNGAALAKLMCRTEDHLRGAVRLYTQLIQAFKELKNEVPADVLANMARANLRLNRYEEAVHFYEQAIKKYGDKVPFDILKYSLQAEIKLRELQEASIKVAE